MGEDLRDLRSVLITWIESALYRSSHTVTQALGFCGFIQRTTTFRRLVSKIYWGPIQTGTSTGYGTFELRIRPEFYCCSNDVIRGHTCISFAHYKEAVKSMFNSCLLFIVLNRGVKRRFCIKSIVKFLHMKIHFGDFLLKYLEDMSMLATVLQLCLCLSENLRLALFQW